jgi:hypothetical protein
LYEKTNGRPKIPLKFHELEIVNISMKKRNRCNKETIKFGVWGRSRWSGSEVAVRATTDHV